MSRSRHPDVAVSRSGRVAPLESSTPTFWTLTPTQAYPSPSNSVWDGLKSAPRSLPAVTFNHSTTTTPLKASGSAGQHEDPGDEVRARRGLGLPPPSGSHVPIASTPSHSRRSGAPPRRSRHPRGRSASRSARRRGVPGQGRLAGDRVLRREAAVGEDDAAGRTITIRPRTAARHPGSQAMPAATPSGTTCSGRSAVVDPRTTAAPS